MPPTHEPEADPAWLRNLRRRLGIWYDRHARPLPWRASRDPYRIWISEIMLQQTTVAAVGPYFERFLAAFPSVAALAAADEHEVLRLWEGLGYYSRARNLHATARRIVSEHEGRFPRTSAELHALPGIGRYTAGAVASFAFDEPAPIVEANTLRLYARLIAYEGDPRSAAGQKRLWDFAAAIVPQRQAGRFNQAVMELGGTICTVKNPRCNACPVMANCRAFSLGVQDRLPVAKAKQVLTDVTEAYVAARNPAGELLLRRRAPGERWAGLWDFPRVELASVDLADFTPIFPDRRRPTLPLGDAVPRLLRSLLERRTEEQTGVRVSLGEPIAELRHGVTRFRIRLICFAAETAGAAPRDADVRFFAPDEIGTLALSRPGRRLADLLAQGRQAT